MPIKFFNTLTNQLDEFIPQKDEVTMYTCGPTVYSHPHIGNWAAYIYWDTLVRTLMANGYKVNRVMNITDVGHLTSDADDGDDKLEKGAKKEGKTAWEIAKQYTTIFLDEMKQLNLITPTHITKATDYINQQLDLIKILKSKGYTYQIDDGIYYDTSKFPTYSEFAHLNLEEQKAGARVDFNQNKKNNSDFAVWKFTPSGEKRDMQWETPTDILDAKTDKPKMGFPGWHLECSTMAINILGNTIDIHTGGIDHIQIHHTNEIAQSEAVTGQKFCNYWLHNNFITVNDTKISKSLGNVYLLSDITNNGFSIYDFKMFILQGHYRSEGNFTFKNLESAKNRLHKWRNISALRHQVHDTLFSDSQRKNSNTPTPSYAATSAIIEALNNDLGTPEALKIIDETFTKITNTPSEQIDRQALLQLIETIDTMLGLNLINSTPDISDDIKSIIIERNSARINKDWAKSDKLRNQLLENNIVIRDIQNGSIWEYKE